MKCAGFLVTLLNTHTAFYFNYLNIHMPRCHMFVNIIRARYISIQIIRTLRSLVHMFTGVLPLHMFQSGQG